MIRLLWWLSIQRPRQGQSPPALAPDSKPRTTRIDDDLEFDPFVEDPGLPVAFRAFVTAVVGWLIFFLAPVGIGLAIFPFVYAIVLAVRSLRVSIDRTRSVTLKCLLSVCISVIGLVAIALFGFDMFR